MGEHCEDCQEYRQVARQADQYAHNAAHQLSAERQARQAAIAERDDHIAIGQAFVDEINRLSAQLKVSEQQRDAAVSALPDPGLLWSLSVWLDAKYPGDTDPEVQNDLRRWARGIYALDPEKYGQCGVYEVEDGAGAVLGSLPAGGPASDEEPTP